MTGEYKGTTMKSIRLYATVQDVVGSKRLAVPFEDGDTVHDLIRAIEGVCPTLAHKLLDEQGQLSPLIHVYVRGRNVEWLEGLETVITDQDEVFIVPPMAGG
jgi:sulfur-carrier protein